MAWTEGTCQGSKEGKMPRSPLLVPTEQQLEVLGQPLRCSAHSQSRVGFMASMRETIHSHQASVSPFVRGGLLCGSLV